MAQNSLLTTERNNLFYSEDDFLFEEDIAENYIEEDLNQNIVIYKVDRERTNNDTLYKESKNGIIFKDPIEIPCQFEIEDAQLKSYNSKTANAVYQIGGNLKVWVSVMILEKYKTDIDRGDYAGIVIDSKKMVFYVITDDGKVNTSNGLYVGAYKPGWRIIKGTVSNDIEFNGK